jgi:hypothetical protein
MNQKKVKSIRRQVNKQTDRIKIAGLRQFINHVQNMGFGERLVFGVQIIFNRVKI